MFCLQGYLKATTRADSTGLSVDIIGISGALQVEGSPINAQAADGLLRTTATSGIDAAVVLTDGQMLTGDTLTVSHKGSVYEIPVVKEGAALAGALATTKGSITLTQEDTTGAFGQTGHLIRVGQNNLLQDITLIVPEGNAANNSKGQQSAAISNAKGIVEADENLTVDNKITYNTNGSNFVPFGNLKLTNVDVTGGGMVYFNVDGDAATESTVTIEGGTYSIINPYVGKRYDDEDGVSLAKTSLGAITLINQADSRYFGRHALSGMSISVSQSINVVGDSGSNIAGIAMSHLNDGGFVSGNRISAEAYTNHGVAGVMVSSTLSGVIGSAVDDVVDCSTNKVLHQRCGNQFSEIKGQARARGVWIEDPDDTGDATAGIGATGSINSNSFAAITADRNSAVGILVQGMVEGHIGCADGQTGACGNTFAKRIEGNNYARGIFIDDPDDTGTTATAGIGANGSINSNSFAAITAKNESAGGIMVQGMVNGHIGCVDGQTGACGNTFAKLIEGNNSARGIYIDDPDGGGTTVSAGIGASGSINSNSFAVITAKTNDAFGIVVQGMVNGHIGCTETITSNCGNQFSVEIKGKKHALGIFIDDPDNTGQAIAGIGATGSINSNTFAAITAETNNAFGIVVQGMVEGHIGCVDGQTGACGNTFAKRIEGNNKARGIFIEDPDDAGTTASAGIGVSGSINSNSFVAITADANDAYGIVVQGMVEGHIGCMGSQTGACGNQFAAEIKGKQGAIGIDVKDLLAGGVIDRNTFTGISAVGAAIGVRIDVTGANKMQGDITNNVFNNDAGGTYAILSTGNYVKGIHIAGAMQGDSVAVSEISGNTFNGAITSSVGFAAGLYIGRISGGDKASIRHNTFNVISNSTGTDQSAYGMYFGNPVGVAAENITNNTLNVEHTTDPANAIGISLANGDDEEHAEALRNKQGNQFSNNLADVATEGDGLKVKVR